MALTERAPAVGGAPAEPLHPDLVDALAGIARTLGEVATAVGELMTTFDKWRPLLERVDPESNPVAAWRQLRSARKGKPCGCSDTPPATDG